MDPAIKARFNDDILAEALARFAVKPEQARLLDGFESFIYEFTRGAQEYILRVGHSQRRSEALIQAEVDWINYLDAGLGGPTRVARAELSAAGRLVERVPDGRGGDFLATAFAKAPGRAPRRDDWTPALYQTYGALTGRMHALAKRYPAPPPEAARYHWDDPQNIYTERQLMPAQPEAAQAYLDLMETLRALPRGPEDYGMIHQDAHSGNFFYEPESGTITLFDFDDCCYGHFIYDIAMVIFYHAQFRDDDRAFMDTFLTNFFAGYRRENRLNPDWLDVLPGFIRLREVDLYGAILHSFTPEEIAGDGWLARFMTGRKENILAGRPMVHYPWQALKNLL